MPHERLLKKIGLLGAMILAATASQAQLPVQLKDAPPPQPDDLVVTARPEPTAQDVGKQAKALSRMVDFYREPLARFADGVCPGVMGFPTEPAGMLVDRIRYNAARVGARVAPQGKCKANVIVAFVRDGNSRVSALMDGAGYLFSSLETAEAKELEKETGPVRAWNVTMLVNRVGGGEVANINQNGSLYLDGPSPGLGPMRTFQLPNGDSRVFLTNRIDILYSVVVIDVAAVDGLSIDQIADYATMRALARTRPASGGAAATILSLFDPAGRPPPQLTGFDIAYLRSLYQPGASLPASARIGGVARALREERARALRVSAPQE